MYILDPTGESSRAPDSHLRHGDRRVRYSGHNHFCSESYIVTGQDDDGGTTASQRCDSHTVIGVGNPHGTVASRTVLGRQKSQTTTANQPEQMTKVNSADRHGVTTVDNNESTRSN